MELKAMRRKLTIAMVVVMIVAITVERIAVIATVVVAVERVAVTGTVATVAALAAEVRMKMRADAVLVGVADGTNIRSSLPCFLFFSRSWALQSAYMHIACR